MNCTGSKEIAGCIRFRVINNNVYNSFQILSHFVSYPIDGSTHIETPNCTGSKEIAGCIRFRVINNNVYNSFQILSHFVSYPIDGSTHIETPNFQIKICDRRILMVRTSYTYFIPTPPVVNRFRATAVFSKIMPLNNVRMTYNYIKLI